MVALQTHRRTEAQWVEVIDRVYSLEDENKNQISNEKVFKRQTTPAGPTPLWRRIYSPSLEWYFRCVIQPRMLQAAAGVAVIMSVFVIWSEVTFFIKSPPLSMFAIFISAARENHDYRAIEMITFCTICYLSISAYYTVFK